ncbi:MAG: 50S ribosomal protein L15e, partial [Candidatus Thermoplasmatota archaeon]
MVKSIYKHLRNQWKKHDTSYKSPQQRRMTQWRKEENFKRIERPTKIDRARALGYKAKQGYVVARTKVRKGSLKKPAIKGGRKPSKKGIRKITGAKNKKRVSEERTNKNYPNLEVLNSYKVGEDGRYHYYEVIMVDPIHPAVMKDPDINWISNVRHKKRVLRGKTSAGKKGRGLRKKGKGAEKIR